MIPMNTEKREAFLENLRALRRVLVVSVIGVVVLFLILFYGFCDPLMDLILAPVRNRGINMIATAVSEALLTKFKVCLVAAVVCAMPLIMQQIWSFVSPALYPQEKKMFAALFFVALILFIGGVVFCCFFVFPLAIDLFWASAEGVASTMWSVQEYYNFVLSFVLPFGVMFELPVILYMLAKKDKVTYESLAKYRKYVVLVIAIAAAILTPPDVVSQLMLGIPMYLLYEISVQIVRVMKRHKPA